MSFVSMVVRSEFLSVVSDGRVLLKNARNIVNEHYNKIIVTKEDFVFACCGHKEIGFAIGDSLNQYYDGNMDTALQIILHAVEKIKGMHDFRVRLFFGGRVNYKIIGYHLDSYDCNLLTLPSEQGKVKLVCNDNEKEVDLKNMILDELMYAFTLEETQIIQKKMNDKVAEYEDSVNTVHFTHAVLNTFN